MSDISFFSSPGDTAFLLALGLVLVLAVAMIACLLVAWLKCMGSGKRMANDRFFGYFLGAGASALATAMFIAVVEFNNHGAFAGWTDDWPVVWIGGMVAIWLAVAYRWNLRGRHARSGTVEQA